MIRNVVLGRVVDESPQTVAAIDAALAGIGSLQLPGLVAMHIGRDLALRPGGWSFAITNDWVDTDAYRGYDTDPEHNTYRARIVELCAEVARVQFELPDSEAGDRSGGVDASS